GVHPYLRGEVARWPGPVDSGALRRAATGHAARRQAHGGGGAPPVSLLLLPRAGSGRADRDPRFGRGASAAVSSAFGRPKATRRNRDGTGGRPGLVVPRRAHHGARSPRP